MSRRFNPEAALLSQQFDPLEHPIEIGYSKGVDGESIEYGKDVVETVTENIPNVMSSRIHVDQKQFPGWELHMPMIDIDVPARLLPSSTPDHWHLIFPETKVYWKDYKELLKVLAKCGIIEKGYASASVNQQKTILRLPWVKKND
jgi:hypothetical protein